MAERDGRNHDSSQTCTSAFFRFGSAAGVNRERRPTVSLLRTTQSIAAVTITVTFNGTGTGGGGSNILTPSQSSVTLPGNGNVTLSTTSASTISLTASVTQTTCTNVSWLGFQLPVTTVSSSASTTLTVTANSSGLTSGQVCSGYHHSESHSGHTAAHSGNVHRGR